MLKIKAAIGESSVQGKGCFTQEALRPGQVIGDFVNGYTIISDEFHLANITDPQIRKTAVVWIPGFSTYEPDPKVSELDPGNFINHSSSPNVLYHCGVLFSYDFMAPWTELTVDYRQFFLQGDSEVLGEEFIEGVEWPALLKSTVASLAGVLEYSEAVLHLS